jgi:hypothetical protein
MFRRRYPVTERVPEDALGRSALHDLTLDRWGHDEADGLERIVRGVTRKILLREGAHRTLA